jgi:hypothetical protein
VRASATTAHAATPCVRVRRPFGVVRRCARLPRPRAACPPHAAAVAPPCARRSAVEVDGGHFREVHAGWQAVVNDGTVRGVLHDDAWDTFKREAGSTELKRRLIDEAIRDR